MYAGGAENLWVSDLCGVWAESTNCDISYYLLILLCTCRFFREKLSVFSLRENHRGVNNFADYENGCLLSLESQASTLSLESAYYFRPWRIA